MVNCLTGLSFIAGALIVATNMAKEMAFNFKFEFQILDTSYGLGCRSCRSVQRGKSLETPTVFVCRLSLQ